VSALLDRAGPFGFPLPVAEIKLGLHGPIISPPVLSAIQAKTIGPNAGGEGKRVAQSEGGQAHLFLVSLLSEGQTVIRGLPKKGVR